jgi:hypothetical protein
MAQMTEIIVEKSTTLVYRDILGIVLESEELEYETVGGGACGLRNRPSALFREARTIQALLQSVIYRCKIVARCD